VFAFFTFVAGTNVFGIQWFLREHEAVARALWLTALGRSGAPGRTTLRAVPPVPDGDPNCERSERRRR
jgi:hypothetical protein